MRGQWLTAGWVMLVVAGALAGRASGEAALAPPGDELRRLVLADEFDGEALDTGNWIYRTTTRGKLSICLPENVVLADGRLRIDLKKERHGDFALTCGGAITRQKFQYGYIETAAQMDAGYGWHEAFWTTNTTNFQERSAEVREEPHIEIDAFEHYGEYDSHRFTYGVIQWKPIHGSVSRSFVETDVDLAASSNVYGFEITPDYIAFFFNGKLLEVVDARQLPHSAFHVWLSAIGTKKDVENIRDGACHFDYFRAYELDFDSPAYAARRDAMLAQAPDSRLTKGSDGIDIWIEAEDFTRRGGWSLARSGAALVLVGGQDRVTQRAGDPGTARTTVNVATGGRYRLWVRSRDYEREQPGARYFGVAINGELDPQRFGTHGEEGLAWQSAGVYELSEGGVTIELVDTSGYFARCDKLLLTTDLDYTPEAAGGTANALHLDQD